MGKKSEASASQWLVIILLHPRLSVSEQVDHGLFE